MKQCKYKSIGITFEEAIDTLIDLLSSKSNIITSTDMHNYWNFSERELRLMFRDKIRVDCYGHRVMIRDVLSCVNLGNCFKDTATHIRFDTNSSIDGKCFFLMTRNNGNAYIKCLYDNVKEFITDVKDKLGEDKSNALIVLFQTACDFNVLSVL